MSLFTSDNKVVNAIGDGLKVFSPALGTALGSPLAGAALSFLIAKLFPSDETQSKVATPSNADVLKLISQASPDTILAIKQAEYEFLKFRESLQLQELDLNLKDVQSARELSKNTIKPQFYMSIMFIIGYFIVLFGSATLLATTKDLNASVLTLFTALLGILTASIPQILSFWFGSSKNDQVNSEANKSLQDAMQNIMSKQVQTISTVAMTPTMQPIVNAIPGVIPSVGQVTSQVAASAVEQIFDSAPVVDEVNSSNQSPCAPYGANIRPSDR
jgi:hypothetical protein